MSILSDKDLIESESRYNDKYCCKIQKVEFLPGIIRVYIDERGDFSLGPLQHPTTSTLGIVYEDDLSEAKNPIDSKFTVNDEDRQYLGYLDFTLEKCFFDRQPTIGFVYGKGGYSTAKLFHFNKELIKKFHLKST